MAGPVPWFMRRIDFRSSWISPAASRVYERAPSCCNKKTMPTGTTADRDELAAEAASLAQAAIDHPLLQHLNPESGRYQTVRGWNVGHTDGLEAFGERVLRSVGCEWGTLHYRSMNGFTAITPYAIGQWVVAQSRVRPAEDVLREFASLVSGNRATYVELVALWGLEPSTSVDLGVEGIQLVPIEQVPRSDYTDALTGLQILNIPESGIPLAMRPLATAVLVREVEVHPLFLPRGATSASPVKGSKTKLMYDLAAVLTAITGTPVVAFGSWAEAKIGTPYITTLGGGFNVTRAFLAHKPRPHAVDAALLRELVPAYAAMSDADRTKLRVPLERLTLALAEQNDRVEAMIDLGIAMEAFLCPGQESEVRYRFSLRGARFLGGSAETQAALRELYDARSRAVHNGDLKGPATRQIELFEKGRDLFIEMLQKAVRARALPDWNDVELRGSDST
jgi:hypothetical protein